MAEKLITAIRTEEGDLKIDYQSLANKPQFDSNWKAENNLADATVVNNKIKGVEDKVNQANNEIDQLAAVIESLGGDLGDIDNKGFITAADLVGYVTDSELDDKLTEYAPLSLYSQASKYNYGVVKIGDGISVSNGVISVASGSGTSSEDYVTETELANKGYVTATMLANQKYLTESTLPKANNYSSTYGVVLPSTTDFKCSNGYLQLEAITLEKLSNVHVLSSQVGANQTGHWYLIPAEQGDG